MAKYKGKKLTELKGDARAKRIKELLGNPGTRKLVPTADLPAQLKAKRDLNTRLNAPIVPGSAMTQRDLSHSREAAVTTQFGPNAVGALQKREGETAGWFDEYQRRLAEHRANVQGFGEQAAAQTANLGNVQGAPGSAPQDPGVAGQAGQAQAVRDALLGSMRGQQAGQSRAANTYADTLANVVAPGQKVQALGTARANTDALKGKIGAFRTQFEGEARQSEGKNVLAVQALTQKTAAQQAQDQIAAANAQTAAARVSETHRANVADENKPPSPSEQKTQQQIDYFNKHGYYPKTGPAKGPKAAKPGDPATADAKAFYKKYGVKPAGTGAIAGAQSEIQSAQSLVNTIRKSNPKITRQQLGQLLLQGQAGSSKKGQESIAIPKVKGLWATVALDLWKFNGKISAGTANKLHRAGYSVKALGLKTGDETAALDQAFPNFARKVKKT